MGYKTPRDEQLATQSTRFCAADSPPSPPAIYMSAHMSVHMSTHVCTHVRTHVRTHVQMHGLPPCPPSCPPPRLLKFPAAHPEVSISPRHAPAAPTAQACLAPQCRGLFFMNSGVCAWLADPLVAMGRMYHFFFVPGKLPACLSAAVAVSLKVEVPAQARVTMRMPSASAYLLHTRRTWHLALEVAYRGAAVVMQMHMHRSMHMSMHMSIHISLHMSVHMSAHMPCHVSCTHVCMHVCTRVYSHAHESRAAQV